MEKKVGLKFNENVRLAIFIGIFSQTLDIEREKKTRNGLPLPKSHHKLRLMAIVVSGERPPIIVRTFGFVR